MIVNINGSQPGMLEITYVDVFKVTGDFVDFPE